MLPNKQQFFAMSLEQAGEVGTVMALVDPRNADLDMPGDVIAAALTTGVLVVRYSLRFGVPVDVQHDGVHCRLSFAGRPRPTFVPWTALLGIVEESTGAQLVWRQEENAAQAVKPRHGLRLVNSDTETN